MRRLFVAGAIALLGTLGPVEGAAACSCRQIPAKEAIRAADAALVGRLVEVIPRSDVQADYRYRVQRVYKGGRRIGSVVSVRSALQGSTCGLPQETDRSYGLLLNRADGRWWGGLCGLLSPKAMRRAADCAS